MIEVGGPYLLEQHGLAELPIADKWRTEGAIILHVVADGVVIGDLRLADEIRPESHDAVDALHAVVAQVVVITGAAPAVAETVDAELGFDLVVAGVRPASNADKGAECLREGRQRGIGRGG